MGGEGREAPMGGDDGAVQHTAIDVAVSGSSWPRDGELRHANGGAADSGDSAGGLGGEGAAGSGGGAAAGAEGLPAEPPRRRNPRFAALLETQLSGNT